MGDQALGQSSPAHRLPAATRVGSVRLQITNLDRSVDYYAGVLGFEVRTQNGHTAGLAVRGEAESLLVLQEERGVKRVPHGGLLGLYHFAILLPDRSHLGCFVRHLARRGVRFASADHFVSEALYLLDPDGLGIEVYADRPRETWESRGGELVMGTEPLDLQSLVNAAGAAEWDGMPPGTTMGHMHLSVGELPGARAFYDTAVGLDPRVWSYPGALFLSAGGYHHHLGLNTWAAGARVAADADARLIEWRLILPSVADVAQVGIRLQAAGYQVGADETSRIVKDPVGVDLRLTDGS